MRLRTLLVTTAAALLLALAPYTVQWQAWQYDPANYPKIVAWAGCHAQVYVNEYRPVEDSFYVPSSAGSEYGPPGHSLVIGASKDSSLPYYAGLFILMHETGHCLQDESGWLSRQTELKTVELDADRRAADIACGLGLDGRKILLDTFEWAHEHLGYDGDEDHGTLAEREAQGALARACDRGHIEQ